MCVCTQRTTIVRHELLFSLLRGDEKREPRKKWKKIANEIELKRAIVKRKYEEKKCESTSTSTSVEEKQKSTHGKSNDCREKKILIIREYHNKIASEWTLKFKVYLNLYEHPYFDGSCMYSWRASQVFRNEKIQIIQRSNDGEHEHETYTY